MTQQAQCLQMWHGFWLRRHSSSMACCWVDLAGVCRPLGPRCVCVGGWCVSLCACPLFCVARDALSVWQSVCSNWLLCFNISFKHSTHVTSVTGGLCAAAVPVQDAVRQSFAICKDGVLHMLRFCSVTASYPYSNSSCMILFSLFADITCAGMPPVGCRMGCDSAFLRLPTG